MMILLSIYLSRHTSIFLSDDDDENDNDDEMPDLPDTIESFQVFILGCSVCMDVQAFYFEGCKMRGFKV